MTTPITPTTSSIITTLTGPADGEVANALSVNSVFQVLDNNVSALRLLTYGGGFRVRLSCTSNTVMTIQPLGAVVVTVATVWNVLANTTASTVNPTTIAGGSLSASTRYYVYAYSSGGVLTFIANTTAPDVGLMYENGNTDRQFVTTFFADHASNILIYNQEDRYYSYMSRTTGGVRGNMVLNAGVAIVPTDINFAASVPSTAKIVRVQVYVTSSEGPGTGNVINFSGFPAASSDLHNGLSLVASTAGVAAGQFETPLINTAFSYSVTNAAKDTASAWIAGFSY